MSIRQILLLIASTALTFLSSQSSAQVSCDTVVASGGRSISEREYWAPFYFANKPYANELSKTPPAIIQNGGARIVDTFQSLVGFQVMGAGLHIGNGVVITAAHVVRDITEWKNFKEYLEGKRSLKSFEFYKNSDSYFMAKVMAMPEFSEADKRFLNINRVSLEEAFSLNDWAVIDMPVIAKRKQKPLHLTFVNPTEKMIGEPVWVVGNSHLSFAPSVSAGELSQDESGNFYIANIQLEGGFSGGAILNKDGAILGIASNYFPTRGVAGFVPIGKIKIPKEKLFWR